MNLFKFKFRKDNMYKRKISLILVIAVLFTLFNFKINDVKAETKKEIRILEIQSSQSYVLKSSSDVNGYKVTVDQVGMPEFIGRVDQLNGKYDVIVIGNKRNAYTNPFSSKPTYIYHNGQVKLNASQLFGSGDHIEYYSENDITNKRAEEIKDMINSGQLVYIESNILSGSSLSNTKLYSNFKDINKDNFKRVSVNNLNLKNIVSDYNKIYYESKRPVFELTKVPAGDSSSINLENRNMIFEGKITSSTSNESLIVNLYIDVNGDSLFRDSDKELVATKEVNISGNEEAQFQLNYTMPTDFIGQLDWKIEVERKTSNDSNVKSYKTGQVEYESINGKKQKINVLQVYLDESSKLNENRYFNKLIAENRDYEIILNYCELSEFNKGIDLDYFDMITIGFDDDFYWNSLSDKAIEKIKEFIKTGQSVMFTHDTISLNYDSNLTTQQFRDILGQARFKDKKNNPDGRDSIEHDTELENKLSDDQWTMGYTKSHLDRYNGFFNKLNTSSTVSEINSGLISQYPFELSSTIKVVETHGQYYQLNLEHPDLVPWYVFNDNNYKNNDARNNYYTYSIGNLTYSGTGHSNDLSSYGEDEIKLFINTIVKAARGANSAPTIEALSDGVTEVSNVSDFKFNAIIKDFNGDQVKITEVIVVGSLDSNTGAIQNGTGQNIWDSKSEQYYDSGSSFDITIPKDIIEKNSGKEINITIKAIDDRGAKSEKTYKIKPVAEPILKVYDYEFNGIAGETATIYMTMEKQNNDNSSKEIHDIKAQILENNFIDVNKIEIDENTNKIKVTFKTKGLIDGESVDLNVNYKVENEYKSTTAKIILYTKNLNEIPDIKVNLISEKRVNYSGGEVEVKYEIIPEEFEYIENTNNTQNKEVTFIIDTSRDMEALDKVKTALINRMINHFLNNGNNIKFNIITYNSTVDAHIVDPEAKDNNGVPIDYRNALQNEINSISKSSSEEKKLGEAIKRADEIFSENGDSNSLKNIIIIASGDPTDNFPSINTNIYNIITLALNKVDNYNNPEENYKNPYDKLNEWHNLLGGKENNYFVSAKRGGNNDIDSGTEITNKNPLAPNGDIMAVIAKRIEELKNTSYIFNDVKLNFDLASNFDAISGLQIENESNYSVRLPEIVYTPIEQVSDNYYKYKANPIEISFKIKPKEGKIGDLKFGENTLVLSNYISYTTLGKEIKREWVETPCIVVEEEPVNVSGLTHGLYEGLNENGSVSIYEKDEGFEIAAGSTVDFGSTFTLSGSKPEINLEIAANLYNSNNYLKIYSVKDGKLEKISENVLDIKKDETNHTITITIEDTFIDNKFLILYSAKVPENSKDESFINTIEVSGLSKDVSIITPEQSNDEPSLPDLF